MDNIDKIHYKDSKKKFKRYTNTQLILETLGTLLDDVNQLKAIVASSYPNMVSTKALKDELFDRISYPYPSDLKE